MANEAEVHAQVLAFQPAGSLSQLQQAATTADKKSLLGANPSILKALIDSAAGSDEGAAQWSLTTLYDLLRADGSCFTFFEGTLPQLNFYKQMLGAMTGAKNDFVADKSAWLLSGVIGNVPAGFSEGEVRTFLKALGPAEAKCSEQGSLDAVVNVLKAGSAFRGLIDANHCLHFDAQTAAPALVYKKMFMLWLLSFSGESLPFAAEKVVAQLKAVLTCSRVEKVVRLSLACLQSLLSSNKEVADEVVEQGLLEVVQALEYEKWRDADLYDEIRAMSGQISTRTAEMSNFARYERELSAGKLKWGFIHSPKFWSENVLKFEQNDWRALKALSGCLDLQGDPTTVAVACRDLGEFVTNHPLGKKQIGALGVKDKVMKLMSNPSEQEKEVRREALLCCQKIMLQKWQDVETA